MSLGAGVPVNKRNTSLTPSGTDGEQGQIVVGRTEGCYTIVVQQLEKPDRRTE